jgi:hypothetical protein
VIVFGGKKYKKCLFGGPEKRAAATTAREYRVRERGLTNQWLLGLVGFTGASKHLYELTAMRYMRCTFLGELASKSMPTLLGLSAF